MSSSRSSTEELQNINRQKLEESTERKGSNELTTKISELNEEVVELKETITYLEEENLKLTEAHRPQSHIHVQSDVEDVDDVEEDVDTENTTTTTSTSSNLSNVLNFTGIDFLDSEVADLKEFFEIRTESVVTEWANQKVSNFLIKIHLSSICLIRENVENETILLSILVKTTETAENKLESKSKSGLEVEVEFDENKKGSTEDAEEEIEKTDDDDDKDNNIQATTNTNTTTATEKEEIIPPNYNSSSSSNSLPYQIKEFSLEEQKEEETDPNYTFTAILTDILNNILSNNNNNNTSSSNSSSMSLLSLIEEFYFELERYNYPSKDVIIRDYYYPIFDSRHWGRFKNNTNNNSGKKSHSYNNSTAHHQSHHQNININNSSPSDITININSSTSPGNNIHISSNISYNARALYDFQALMQGELSFQENEVLQVLANLGNGWLTARKVLDDNNSTDDLTGLIPENYIERI